VLAGRDLQCQKAKSWAATPTDREEIMSGNLEHLDPTSVLIGDNVRDAAALDAQFVASITEHGVLQPVTAVRTDAGVEVRDGQRRTLAARQAGLTSIPVYVLHTPTSTGKAAVAERITQQIVANDHRTPLTDAQRAEGINQMLLSGVSAARVAKKLSVNRDTVAAPERVAKSESALGALRSGQMSLSEAAVLQEFDDDQHAIETLTSAAGTASFDHRVAQRPDREPVEGARHASTVVEKVLWIPEYYCRAPQDCGLTLADFLTRAKPISTGGCDDHAGAETDVDAKRAERRKVLALNKLGAAAQQVRRAWVRDHLLSRKAPVKGAAVFITTCLDAGPGLLADYAGGQIAGELLGLGDNPVSGTVAKLGGSADDRAQMLLLGMVLAALEGRTPKDAWRNAKATWMSAPGAAQYLRFLAANGYVLSPIEQVVTGERDADAVYQELTRTRDCSGSRRANGGPAGSRPRPGRLWIIGRRCA
jgi:ParB-like chromosome segregation protein Spo0J